MKSKHIVAYMDTAKAWAKCSYAKRLQVGACAMRDGAIIGTGYNGTPHGMDNCCEDENGNTKPEVIHAEQNCLNKILRSHNSSICATMFITHSPCLACAIKMVDAGIIEVIYEIDYRDDSGIKWLLKNGIFVKKYEDIIHEI